MRRINKKKLDKYLHDTYWKHGQYLYLHSETVEPKGKDRTYCYQEVFVQNSNEPQIQEMAKRFGISEEELVRCAKEDGIYDEGHYDKFLFDIRTLDETLQEAGEVLGAVPYFMIREGFPTFTIQEFRQITDEDIFFAIQYFLRYLDSWMLFNLYYNDRRVSVPIDKLYPSYRKDNDDLAYYKHYEKLRNENKRNIS